MNDSLRLSQSPGVPQNQGYAIFKTALEENPDILAFIKTIAHTEPKELIAQRKANSILKEIQAFHRKHRPASGHKYGVYERFSSRPTSAPGPGQYIQRKLSAGGGHKMQSRNDPLTEMTPGPQSYLVSDVRDSTLGIMTREPKFKDNSEFYQTFLGPGSYEIGGALNDTGWKFAKEGRDSELDPATGTKQRSEPRPGPGHYSTKSEMTGTAFSMAKAPKGHKKVMSMLGPGTYKIEFPKDSVDFKFSAVPRFSQTFKERMENYKPRYRRKSVEEREAEKECFEQNKDLSKHRKDARRRSLEEQGAHRDMQIAIANQTKTTIAMAEKMRKKIAYEEKMQRFHFRMRKEEIAEMQVAWFIAAAFASSLCDIHRGYEALKALHIRSAKLLKRFRTMCMIVGKLRDKLRCIRKRRSLIILKHIIPFAGRWMRKRKRKHINVISHVLEEAVLGKIIFKIMLMGISKINMIQEYGRRFVSFRRIHYAVAKASWEALEKSLRLEAVPEKVKEFFICKRFRQRSKQFLREMKDYDMECMRIAKVNKKLMLKAQVEKVAGLDYEVTVEIVQMRKPIMKYQLSQDEVRELISQAVAKQNDYGNILKAMVPPLIRSGTRYRSAHRTTLSKADSTEELMRALYYSKMSYLPAKSAV